MKKIWLALLSLGLFQGVAAADMAVMAAWARQTVPGMQMGGVFMQLANQTDTDDVLLGGETTVARRVEVHQVVQENGVMRMRQIENGLPLAKDAVVLLKPGSFHIMLMGLQQPLLEGQQFPLTLYFRNAPAKTVNVAVKAADFSQQQDNGGHHH